MKSYPTSRFWEDGRLLVGYSSVTFWPTVSASRDRSGPAWESMPAFRYAKIIQCSSRRLGIGSAIAAGFIDVIGFGLVCQDFPSSSRVPQPLPFETPGSNRPAIDSVGFARWVLRPLLKHGE
jgi:hypothetical protein